VSEGEPAKPHLDACLRYQSNVSWCRAARRARQWGAAGRTSASSARWLLIVARTGVLADELH